MFSTDLIVVFVKNVIYRGQGLIGGIRKNVIYRANCGISEKCCLQGLIVVLVINVIYRANCGISEKCYLQG